MDLPKKRTIQRVLRSIMLQEPAELYFNEPVDPDALGIPEYFEIIKRPMDLGTIMRKVNNDEFLDERDVYDSICLVWHNCFEFNRDGSEVSRAGAEMQDFAWKAWREAGLEARQQRDDFDSQASESDGGQARGRGPERRGPAAPSQPDPRAPPSPVDGEPHAPPSAAAALGAREAAGRGTARQDHAATRKSRRQPTAAASQSAGPHAAEAKHPAQTARLSGRDSSVDTQASQPSLSSGPSRRPRISVRLRGHPTPPIPGGAAKLPKGRRTGGHGDPDELRTGFWGRLQIIRRVRTPMTAGTQGPRQRAAAEANQKQETAGTRGPKGGRGPRRSDSSASETASQQESRLRPADRLPSHPLGRCLHAIEKLMQKPGAEPFCTPMDPNEFPGSRELIRRPMDLGTIAEKLRPGLRTGWGTVEYKSVADVANDVAQVWENCEALFEESSPVALSCRRLDAIFRKYCDALSLPLPESYFRRQPAPGSSLGSVDHEPAKLGKRKPSQPGAQRHLAEEQQAPKKHRAEPTVVELRAAERSTALMPDMEEPFLEPPLPIPADEIGAPMQLADDGVRLPEPLDATSQGVEQYARENEPGAERAEAADTATQEEKDVEDEIRQRLVSAAVAQQRTAAQRLAVRRERAHEAIAAVSRALEAVTKAEAFLKAVDGEVQELRLLQMQQVQRGVPGGRVPTISACVGPSCAATAMGGA
uniref:Dna-binding bromodomain-containing protein n=1 Tax=Tetraselmis sp. GSL018 TaxID=582737 RepID=A0A061RZE7_9CHLO